MITARCKAGTGSTEPKGAVRAGDGLAGVLAVALSAGMLLAGPALAQTTVPPATSPPAAAPPGAAPSSVAPSGAPATQSYAPESGQPGKDVVWVPSPDTLIERMLDMAAVTPQDYLIDLGSGDGRTVIAAAQRGLKAHGIEYNPDLVALSQRNAETAGVSDRASFEQADIFETDFSKAQVLTLFLLPELNERLRPTILDMEPGTRVVSNSFPMGDWEPDRTERIGGNCQSWCTALMWVVPAKVAGTWLIGERTLTLDQTYQKIAGQLDGQPIQNGRVNGREIRFTVGGVEYVGTMTGETLSGTGPDGAWTALRS